ncbi:DoxX family protein [Longimicrobium sp.]|uniref:DoxX family protein n=1 Tax=Longimicrobium sp. TaxID=2029185 RepID=UPI002E2F515B|nr:DoxX family protein [Longimicrobium sp.]HEX6038322.1 DoxX family protein [Longimicrobium sp.]
MQSTAIHPHTSAATDATQARPAGRGMVRAGRALSGFAALFLLADGVMRIARFQPYVDGLVQFGYPAHLAVPIGLALTIATVLYIVPRTAVLGAIILTGYLGGAAASHIRMEDPLFGTSLVFAVMVWLGLYLREPRLRALVPLRADA